MGIAYWIDSRVERLKDMHEAGASASQIAAELQDISRNAVIGKIHRLGLPTRGNNGNYKGNGRSPGAPKYVAKFRPKPRLQPIICKPAEDIVSLNLALADLMPGDCRFPYGDGPFTFCGHPKSSGSSYCPSHSAMVRRQDVKPRVGLPAKMPTNMADGRNGRAVFA